MDMETLLEIIKKQDDLLEEYETLRKLFYERVGITDELTDHYHDISKTHEENLKVYKEKVDLLLSLLKTSAEYLLDKAKNEETKYELAWELLDLVDAEEREE